MVDGVPMPLRGRIDRIDERDVDGRTERALLDYKTGDKPKTPDRVHRSRAGWRDLQLPLYLMLAGELGEEEPAKLGYIGIGAESSAVRLLEANWSEEQLTGAIHVAHDVVRQVRGGEFFELGSQFSDDALSVAIAGIGLVAVPDLDGGDEGEDEDEDEEDET